MADGTGETGDGTFTQADVDRVVRERLAREREKFKDYDELKTRAGEADKHKSALDKVLEKVSGLEERATKAEAEALRASVIQAQGLTPRQAKYLRGASKDELEASAKEIKADLPEPGKGDGQGEGGQNGDGGQGGQAGDGKGGDGGQGAAGEGQGGQGGQGGSGSGGAGGNGAATRTRPREALRSGAAVPTGGAEETDPMKLAALVPRI